jgi:hypothetical protein
MRFSYKSLVDRFLIPRPTLIEWQKRVKIDKDNWRVKHLQYLRDQIIIEEQTKNEIKSLPINTEDIFLICVFLFFHPKFEYLDKSKLKKGLREFGHISRTTIEYKHDFAKKIWSIELEDGTKRKISNYHRTFDILDSMSAAQYGIFINSALDFIDIINKKINPSKTDILDGLSWQELHMYDKYFNDKAIEKYFLAQGII